jgi:hypothetical protein
MQHWFVELYYYFIIIIYFELQIGHGTTIRKHTDAYITQNTAPHSNQTQNTKLHKQYRT